MYTIITLEDNFSKQVLSRTPIRLFNTKEDAFKEAILSATEEISLLNSDYSEDDQPFEILEDQYYSDKLDIKVVSWLDCKDIPKVITTRSIIEVLV